MADTPSGFHLLPITPLVRQNVKDASEDYRNLLLGFQYGGVQSVNSLQSVYNFQVHFMNKECP